MGEYVDAVNIEPLLRNREGFFYFATIGDLLIFASFAPPMGKQNTVDNKKKPNNKQVVPSLILGLSNIASSIGVPGLVIVFIIYALQTWTTSDQKKELIDNMGLI